MDLMAANIPKWHCLELTTKHFINAELDDIHIEEKCEKHFFYTYIQKV